MNCIIGADDVSSSLLEEFVTKTSSLNLLGILHDSMSLRDQLSKRHDIDLIILDNELSEKDLLTFISDLDYKPNIIIVSSSDQNAFEAFDFNVIDYLLKPVTFSRFCRAVDKAMRYYSHKEVGNGGNNEIFIKKGSLLVKMKFKDILYIEALENYVTLCTKNEKFTIHLTMKAIENQLPSGIFIRVHRSYIVNKSMIKAIKEDSVDLSIGEEKKNIPIGKSFRDPLLKAINLIVR